MLIVGVGDDPRAAAISAAFRSREDVTLGRVPSISDAAEALAAHAGESCLVMVLAAFPTDREVIALPALSPLRQPIVVLADSENLDLRAAAFQNGAAEILFPPFPPARIEAIGVALLRGHVRSDARNSVPLAGIVRSPDGREHRARVVNLSRGGFCAETSGGLAPGVVVQVALAPPDPWRVPVLYARLLAADERPGGDAIIRAQWVGLAGAEAASLGELVDSLAPETADVVTSLEQIAALDAAALRTNAAIAGIRRPPLTSYERAGIAAESGDVMKFGAVAVARTRAHLAAVLFETTRDENASRAARQIPVEIWREELRDAAATVAQAIAARGKDPSPASIRELRDLESRLTAAQDAIERIFAEIANGRFSKSATPPRATPTSWWRRRS